MPADERRAAIASATLDLLLDNGLSVTTKQIADAAGIAEGTIFRVFPDKAAVLQAAVDLAVDPAPADDAIAAIDPNLPFEAQLTEAVVVVQQRLSHVWRVTSAVGDAASLPKRPPELAALVALFDRHRTDLRYDPEEAARHLRAVTLAVSHPAIVGDDPMPPAAIVSLLLDGIRTRP